MLLYTAEGVRLHGIKTANNVRLNGKIILDHPSGPEVITGPLKVEE